MVGTDWDGTGVSNLMGQRSFRNFVRSSENSKLNLKEITGVEAVRGTDSKNSFKYIPSSELSQVLCQNGDEEATETIQNQSVGAVSFPVGYTDINNQQVDQRTTNSWTLRLHEVSLPEMMEVFAINTIAPTVLNARLKGLMERTKQPGKDQGEEPWLKFIVNVSAMEGRFYKYKQETHPHTNMAKSALNMQCRTSSQDYVKSHIYMTCVDTGWINLELPAERAKRHETRHFFQTPLDEIDAAARILDPMIGPLHDIQNGDKDVIPPYGYFLKDFKPTEW